MKETNKDKEILVSVVIPNYNHAAYLAQRIDSVLRQTYPNFEVIILDDCSTDESRSIIEQYRSDPKISSIIYNEVNSGSVFLQWAKGIAAAKGSFIWIAESDDWAEHTFLQKLVDHLQQDKEVGLIYSNSRVVDSSGKYLYTYFSPEGASQQTEFWADFSLDGKRFIKDYMLNANAIPNASAVLFKRELFFGIPEDYKFYMVNGDWLYWVEVLQKTKVIYMHEPLNHFRTHPNNVRSATYENGVFLPEIFRIQNRIVQILSLNRKERRTLKYNMLNRLFTEKFKQKVSLTGRMFLYCLSLISKVSPGIIMPALRTLVVLKINS